MCTQLLTAKTASPATIDNEVDAMNKSAHTNGNRAAAVIFSVKYRQEGDYRRHRQELMGNLYV